MTTSVLDTNKQAVLDVFAGAFNQGDLSTIDAHVSAMGVDHQHPDEPDFVVHLKGVVKALRTAFPDLHFEITRIIGEDDWVALHSMMTGTHSGPLTRPLLPPDGPPQVPPTGRAIRVPHMHMIRMENGKGVELLHLMDTLTLLGQLGLLPGARPPA